MTILLGILQLATFVMLGAIIVHAFALQAYKWKQLKRSDVATYTTETRKRCGSVPDNDPDLSRFAMHDPLIRGAAKASLRKAR